MRSCSSSESGFLVPGPSGDAILSTVHTGARSVCRQRCTVDRQPHAHATRLGVARTSFVRRLSVRGFLAARLSGDSAPLELAPSGAQSRHRPVSRYRRRSTDRSASIRRPRTSLLDCANRSRAVVFRAAANRNLRSRLRVPGLPAAESSAYPPRDMGAFGSRLAWLARRGDDISDFAREPAGQRFPPQWSSARYRGRAAPRAKAVKQLDENIAPEAQLRSF